MLLILSNKAHTHMHTHRNQAHTHVQTHTHNTHTHTHMFTYTLGGLKGRLPSRGQGAAAVGRTHSARATKYIEFHGSVRLPHVYLPGALLAHYRESELP